MALDTTTRFNRDFTCTECGEDFRAKDREFFLSTERKDAEELRQVKAKCQHCGKWGAYAYEVTEIARVTSGIVQHPKWRSGKLDRMRMDATPSDFAEVIEQSNKKLAENGYEMDEEDG